MTDEIADDSQVELDKLLARGQLLLRTGDLAGAEAAALELAERHPDSTSAHEQLGDVYLAMGKSAQARRHYRCALQIEPANADAERKFAAALVNMSPEEQRRQAIRGLVSGSDDYQPSARRPLNAVVAAVIFPGLGQLYNRQYEKGLALFGGAAVLVMLLFYGFVINPWSIVAHQAAGKSLTWQQQIELAQKVLANMSIGYWALLICGTMVLVAVYVYCIYDAHRTAQEQVDTPEGLGV